VGGEARDARCRVRAGGRAARGAERVAISASRIPRPAPHEQPHRAAEHRAAPLFAGDDERGPRFPGESR
jgi:hypothetical protein